MKTYAKKQDLFNALPSKKYCISQDTKYITGGETKYIHQFLHFETLHQLKKAVINDNHYYEIATNKTRKIYFDIDKLDLSRLQAEEYINNLLKILQDELNISITTNKVNVLCNEPIDKNGDYTDKINSLHIIINGYKMDFKQQQELSTYINDKYNYQLDINVYKTDQNFRMLNQSKLKNGIKFINFYDNTINITETLINYTTSKDKLLTFNRLYDNNEDNTDNKEVKQLSSDDIIYNLIHYDDINNNVFNHNNDWKIITNIIYKYNLYDIDEWCKKSIQLTTNENYTYEKNINYINKLNKDKINSSLNLLYKILSKYSNYYLTNISNINQETLDLLKVIYNDDVVKDVIEVIQKPKKIKIVKEDGKTTYKEQNLYKFINKNNFETIINVKTGFIVDNNKKVINIYYDNMNIKNEKIFKEVNTIQQAKEKLIEFLNNDFVKLMILKSRWGTGKTSNIIQYILNQYADDEYKILIITESNALNSKLNDDFKKYKFVSHQDKNIKLYEHNKIICSIQSINKVVNKTFDFVIIDEYESVLSSYFSNKTFKSANTNPQQAYTTMLNIIKRSYKTLITDADISEDKVKLMIDVIVEENNVICKNNQKTFNDMKLYLYTDNGILYDKLYTFLDNNFKIAIASSSKDKLDTLIEDIQEQKPHKKILKINQDGAFILHNKLLKKLDKNETIQDLENVIIKNDIDVFGYTPTIKTGISINSDYFNITTAITSKYSILYNEMIQMIMRQRKLKNNEIHILLTGYNRYSKNRDINFIERKQEHDKDVFKSYNKDEDITIYKKNETNLDYYNLQTINNKNKYNSYHNYTYNFIYLLKYHNLNYEYVETSYEELENQYNEAIAKKNHKDKLRLDWITTKLLTFDEYNDITNKKNENEETENNNEYINQLDDDTKNKYFKTIQLYSLNNIFNKIKNVSNLEQYNNNYIKTTENYDLFINNEYNELIDKTFTKLNYNCVEFYDNYIYNKNIENIKLINNLFNKEYHYNHTIEDETNIKAILIEQLINAFNSYFNINNKSFLINYDKEQVIFKKQQINNKNFKIFLQKNNELIQNIYNHFTNKTIKIDLQNKEHIKYIYHKIKELLVMIDIDLYYETTTTIRETSIIHIINIENFYKYKTMKEATETLNHLQNNHTILTFDVNDIIPYKELDKYFIETDEGFKLKNVKKINKNKLITLRNTLLLKDLPRYYMINNNKIEFKDYFYNILLNMNLSNSLINKDSYGRYNIELNKKRHQVYKYDNKEGEYYKPYKAKKVIIKTTSHIKPNEDYDDINCLVKDMLNNILDRIVIGDELKNNKVKIIE